MAAQRKLVVKDGASQEEEVVMHLHGCMTVKQAAARTMDGLVVYRCFGVTLAPASAGGTTAAPLHIPRQTTRQVVCEHRRE